MADVDRLILGDQRSNGRSDRAPEDIRIDLSRAIQSLPDHYREVILLRDIEELSIDEISGVLAPTRESVKARIHRARLMIREYLIRD